MNIAALLLFSISLLTPDDISYSGKYNNHRNLAALKKAIQEAQNEAETELKKRLDCDPTQTKILLVDSASMTSAGKKDPNWLYKESGGAPLLGTDKNPIVLQIDYLLGDPTLGKKVAAYLIAKEAMLADWHQSKDKKLTTMGAPMMAIELSGYMAEKYAGLLEMNTAYAICKSLAAGETIEPTMDSLKDATAIKKKTGENPRSPLQERLMYYWAFQSIASYIKEEPEQAEYIKWVWIAQMAQEAFLKITKKQFKVVFEDMPLMYKNYFAKNLPKAAVDIYKNINQAIEKKNFDLAVLSADSFLKQHSNSIAVGNVQFLKAKALYLGKKPNAAETFQLVLDKYRNATPFAKEAQLHLGIIAMEEGDKEKAKAQFKLVKEDFGWDESICDKADEYLGKL